jgi:hypothetical protein
VYNETKKMTKEGSRQGIQIRFPDNRTLEEKQQEARANTLYDKIQDLLWKYPEFTPEEFGAIVQGAVHEHYNNYGNPGDWEVFLNGVKPSNKPGKHK